jgi:hypothetical protein
MQPVTTTSAIELAIGLAATITITGLLVAATARVLTVIDDRRQPRTKSLGMQSMRLFQWRIKEAARRHHGVIYGFSGVRSGRDAMRVHC